MKSKQLCKLVVLGKQLRKCEKKRKCHVGSQDFRLQAWSHLSNLMFPNPLHKQALLMKSPLTEVHTKGSLVSCQYWAFI